MWSLYKNFYFLIFEIQLKYDTIKEEHYYYLAPKPFMEKSLIISVHTYYQLPIIVFLCNVHLGIRYNELLRL